MPADVGLLRESITLHLLQAGVPYAAIEQASTEQVTTWYALSSEQREREQAEIDRLTAQMGR